VIEIGQGELDLQSDSETLWAALALSCVTSRPFTWTGFRRKAQDKGFTQLEADGIRLFAALCDARLEGGEPGTSSAAFTPGPLASGEYAFELSGRRSMLGLLRHILVVLAMAPDRSTLALTGSTHAVDGDTFDATETTWCHFVREAGVTIDVRLERTGFAPRGGGEVVASVAGGGVEAVSWTKRGALDEIRIVSAGAAVPTHVQQRQAARARAAVHISGIEPTVQLMKLRAKNAGSVVAVTGRFGRLPITFAAVGGRGISAETVGESAAIRLRRYTRQSAVVIDPFVESLLVLLAFAEGPSAFTAQSLEASGIGVSKLIRVFTGRHVSVEGKVGDSARFNIDSPSLQT